MNIEQTLRKARYPAPAETHRAVLAALERTHTRTKRGLALRPAPVAAVCAVVLVGMALGVPGLRDPLRNGVLNLLGRIYSVRTDLTNDRTGGLAATDTTLQERPSGNLAAGGVSIDQRNPIDPDIVNILVLGLDSRAPGGNGRSDANLIVSINRKNKTIKLTSLLRDTLVPIEGHDSNRLNEACYLGGPGLAVNTVNSVYGMDIQRYVEVDFNALTDLVDGVDGVDIPLTSAEVTNLRSQGLEISQGAGAKHLNGKEALAYTRIRKIDNDFERTQRQRNVVEAALKKVRSLGVVKALDLMNDLLPQLTTNISMNEMVDLATQAIGTDGGELDQLSLPVKDGYTGKVYKGMSILSVDFEKNTKELYTFLYGPDGPTPAPTSTDTPRPTDTPKGTPPPSSAEETAAAGLDSGEASGDVTLAPDYTPLPSMASGYQSSFIPAQDSSLTEPKGTVKWNVGNFTFDTFRVNLEFPKGGTPGFKTDFLGDLKEQSTVLTLSGHKAEGYLLCALQLSADNPTEGENQVATLFDTAEIKHYRVGGRDICYLESKAASSDWRPESIGMAAIVIPLPEPAAIEGKSYNYALIWAGKDIAHHILKSLEFPN